jgi:hypothetical protein
MFLRNVGPLTDYTALYPRRFCCGSNFYLSEAADKALQKLSQDKLMRRPSRLTDSRHQTFRHALVLYVVSCMFFVLTGEILAFIMQVCPHHFLGHPQAVARCRLSTNDSLEILLRSLEEFRVWKNISDK